MQKTRIILFAVFASLASMLSAYAQYPGPATPGQLIVGQGAQLGLWMSMIGDCTIAQTAAIVCTKTNGVPFYTGLPGPVNPTDAATKQYVDTTATGILVHQQVRLATTTALPASSYNNGASGVGATLTATSNGDLSVDTTVTSPGDRVLVKNQAATANNGVYVVTSTGDASSRWILTRAADAAVAGAGNPNEIGYGSFVLVTSGAVLANTGWMVNSQVTVIGTDPIVWAQFSGANGTAVISSTVLPQGRLTLQPGTPVMTTTQAATSTVYYDCYHGGNLVDVYNGGSDTLLAISACEISDTMPTTGAGVTSAGDVFDLWGINVSGVLTLCHATNGAGGGWKSDTGGALTARGTGYTQLATTARAYITNANALAHCYRGATDYGSVGANQATYLGTLYTTANGQTTYQFGAPGTAGLFGLWNAYNRLPTPIGMPWPSAASWARGNSATWRQADANAAAQVSFVSGFSSELASIESGGTTQAPFGTVCYVAIGLDSTTTVAGLPARLNESAGSSGQLIQATILARYRAYPGIGFHYLAALEQAGSGIGTACTWFGSNNNGGMTGTLWQ